MKVVALNTWILNKNTHFIRLEGKTRGIEEFLKYQNKFPVVFFMLRGITYLASSNT